MQYSRESTIPTEGRCSDGNRGGNKGTANIFLKDSCAVNVKDCSDPSESNEPREYPPLTAADLRSPEQEVSNMVFSLLHPPCWLSKDLCAEATPHSNV